MTKKSSGARSAKGTTSDMVWFSAMFRGTCSGCNNKFEPGTLVRAAQVRMNIPHGWKAACCADE